MSPISRRPGRPTIAPPPSASGSRPAAPASSSFRTRAARRAETAGCLTENLPSLYPRLRCSGCAQTPGLGKQMSIKQDDLAEQLFVTLEQSANRLRAAREEVDGSLALVNLAMAAVAHLRSSTALRAQLGDLLEAQRA